MEAPSPAQRARLRWQEAQQHPGEDGCLLGQSVEVRTGFHLPASRTRRATLASSAPVQAADAGRAVDGKGPGSMTAVAAALLGLLGAALAHEVLGAPVSAGTPSTLRSRAQAEDRPGCRLVPPQGKSARTTPVGEPIDFALHCTAPAHAAAWQPQRGADALVALRAGDAASAPEKQAEDTQVLRVTPLDVGILAFSALRLTTRDGSALTLLEAPALEVINPLLGATPLVARDGTRPWPVLRHASQDILWLLGALTLLALIVLGTLWVRRQRGRRKRRGERTADPGDVLLATVRKWEAILTLDRGNPRDALAEVDQALRQVLRQHASIPAQSLTTEALVAGFRSPSSDAIRMLSVTGREHWAMWFESIEDLRFRPAPPAHAQVLEHIKRARDLTASLIGLPAASPAPTPGTPALSERMTGG